MLLEELEGALLGDISGLSQLLDCLEACCVLGLGYNAALAGLHEVLLDQATGSVLGGSVEDLCLATNCDHAAHLWVRYVLASIAVHFVYTLRSDFFLEHFETGNTSLQDFINKRLHLDCIIDSSKMD